MEVQPNTVVAIIGIVMGGGLASLLTVRRLSRKDVSQSNFDYIREWNSQFKEREQAWVVRFNEQDEKLARMNRELGELSGRLMQAMEHNASKDNEISMLKGELARVTAELTAERATAAALATTALSLANAGSPDGQRVSGSLELNVHQDHAAESVAADPQG